LGGWWSIPVMLNRAIMNRFLIPAGAAALLVGCTLQFPGLQSEEPLAVDSTPVLVAVETTYVVEEVPVEVPVYVEEPVYYEEEEPAPPETVFVVEEYESYVFVSGPPPPIRPQRGLPYRAPHERSSRRQEPPEPEPVKSKPRPRNPNPVEAKPVPPEPVVRIEPEPDPPKPFIAPVRDDKEKAPDKPVPPDQPVKPIVQAPAKDDGGNSASVEAVKPVPGPSDDDVGVADADTGGKKKSPGKSKDR
jgi:hypothetical protein